MSTATPPPPEERRQPFQFSMATLMGAVTLAAVGMALSTALPLQIGVLVLSIAQVVFSAFLLAGAFFAKGSERTFCIGALTIYVLDHLHAPLYLMMGPTFQYSRTLHVLFNIAAQFVAAVIGGLICVRARRFWESRTP